MLIADWINRGLHDYVKKANKVAVATTTRRLTNFEYQNTMRDLLGFELELTKDLPIDPDKPYHFNNTAEMMMIGPDQLVRYKEAARKAMASAIVDPGKPEIHRFSSKWEHGKTRQRRIVSSGDRRLPRTWRRQKNRRIEKLAQDR